MAKGDPHKTIPKPKRYACQNTDCPSRATCRISGTGWTGLHCSPHALGVVEHQLFQVTGPGRATIVIAPLPR